MKTKMIKKLYIALLLSLGCASQTVAATTVTLATDINPTYKYTGHALLSDNGIITASFADQLSTIESVVLNGANYMNSNFYARWFVHDKVTDDYAVAKDFTVTFSFIESNSNYFASVCQEGYGIWCSTGWQTFSSDYCAATITANSSIASSKDNYEVICLLTNEYTYSNNYQGTISFIENSFIASFTFDIKTKEELAASYDFPDLSSVTNTHEETLPYTKDATSMTVDLSDYISDIVSDLFATTVKDSIQRVNYLHFYLLDGNDQPLTDAYSSGFITYQYMSKSSNEDTLTTSTGYYAYYTPEGNWDVNTGVFNGSANNMSYTLTLLANYSWDDIKLVAVLSKGTDGLSIIEDIVVSEPSTLESAFIFSFVQSGVFRHYKGWAYEGKEAEWDTKSGHEMQYTHEYSFEKFVDAGNTVDLKLPIEDRNDTEPRGYHRWYDYNTDAGSPYLVNTTYGKELKYFPDPNETDARNSAGLMAYAISNRLDTQPSWNNWAAVQFNAPSDGWSSESDGQVIACDQSRYIDGIAGGELIHEPTLSMRYKFYVYPTSVCADRLRDAIIANPVSGIYEDHGYVVLGEKSSSVLFNLRTELHKITDYYFYNYSKSDTKITDSSTDVSSDFGTEICNATQIIWRVIDPSGNYYKDFQTIQASSTEYPIISLTRDMLNNANSWNLLDGGTSADNFSYTFTNTSLAYIVAYASDGTNKCPIARFTCRFADEYPIAFDELPENRTLEYLKENYTHVAEVNLDNLDTEHTSLAAPTSPADNQNYLPSSGWNKRFYGFVYYDLYDKMCEASDSYIIGLSCLHGEYGIYKSANVSGVSTNTSVNGYKYYWWVNQPTVYDRTYANTNGSQYGYFLYVDASQEQRQIAEVDFEGDLCAGSVIVVSMAVNSYTGNTTTLPQVMFKLYGIEEDANGEETSRKLLQSFASGDFKTQGCTTQGTWYQVYVKTSLQESTGVENYSKFAITIDNYCGNTQGADYCIDDIHVFMKNSKVEVAQQSIPCSSNQNTSQLSSDLKIRMDYEALMAWIGSDTGWDAENSKTLYWRIIDSDGNVVTNLYGAGNDYGTLRVYNTYAANETQGIGKTDSDGIEYIIIASDLAFTQESGKTYYVSLGKNEDGESEISWGSPTDICSAYSDYFEILTESINITSGGEVMSSLPLTCGTGVTMNLAASMKIPDPVTGGTLTLSGLSYTWAVVAYKEKGDSTIYELTQTATADSLSFAYKEEYVSYDGYIYFKLTLTTDIVTIYAGTKDETTVYLCTDPIIVALKVTSVGPELNLGFSDVTYAAGTTRTVRVGLEQLNDMVTNSKKLVIPLHSYSSVNTGSTSFGMTLQDGGTLTISDTNDPTCKVGLQVGTASEMTYGDSDKSIKLTFYRDSISCFHEGYWYELNFVIGEEYISSICKADVFFTMKIVPEYVTWTGADNYTMSTNWNNDLNWERSAADYIYKTEGYEDYGATGGSYADLATQQAYVPMKFTKVTIDPNIQSARLESLSANSEGIIVSGLMNTEGYSATDDIQYDLMVMVEDELTGTDYECEKFYGNTCKEIYFKPEAEIRYQQYLNYKKAWVEYELEPNKWYMLTSPLKEVYAGDMYVPTGLGDTQGRQETEAFVDISFDKTAGYSRTAYPIYQRSWDKANSLVITPTSDSRGYYDAFINSYTWTGTDATMAEAQWSHTYNDVTVPYTPNATDAQNGFSLRANKQAVTNEGTTVNALIRVPKADNQYDYYTYNDETLSENGRTGQVSKDGGQNLLMDNTSNSTSVTMSLSNQSSDNGLYLVSNPYMASIDMTRFFGVNTNLTPSFWIVKAGVMHAVDIDLFNQSGLTIPTIAPTQAFFVKLTDEATNTTDVTFTTNMITKTRVDLSGNILSNYAKYTQAAAAKASVKSVTLIASYDDKTSKATVVLNADADEDYVDGEDVETVYDSNLADVPTLYTVAGDQAVSVNKLPGISVVPLGIVCSSDVEATVLVTGTSNVEGDLYLIDTQTGTSTVLDDSVTVTVTANDHGRYYLSNMSIESVSQRVEDEEGSGVKCYSPSPGLLTVACLAAGDTLETIDLYTVDGKKLQTISNVDNNTTTLNTYKGIKIVVVKHSGNEKAETAKVAVR